jgi:hypothetical protein
MRVMAAAALLIAVAALMLSIASLVYARRLAAQPREPRAVAPDLRVVLLDSGDYAAGPDLGAYMLRLVGPGDLDSVVVNQPTAADLSTGVAGQPHGSFTQRYDMGPVRVTQSRIFWVGFAADSPAASFDLVVDCRRGRHAWQVTRSLARPQ